MYNAKAFSATSPSSPLGPATIDRREPTPNDVQMLDFCGEHNLTSDVEVIPIQKINEAYERLVRGDVKYRFVIDMASLKGNL